MSKPDAVQSVDLITEGASDFERHEIVRLNADGSVFLYGKPVTLDEAIRGIEELIGGLSGTLEFLRAQRKPEPR